MRAKWKDCWKDEWLFARVSPTYLRGVQDSFFAILTGSKVSKMSGFRGISWSKNAGKNLGWKRLIYPQKLTIFNANNPCPILHPFIPNLDKFLAAGSRLFCSLVEIIQVSGCNFYTNTPDISNFYHMRIISRTHFWSSSLEMLHFRWIFAKN